jgi:hypothetical protein
MQNVIKEKGQYQLRKDDKTFLIVEEGSVRETYDNLQDAIDSFNKIPDDIL